MRRGIRSNRNRRSPGCAAVGGRSNFNPQLGSRPVVHHSIEIAMMRTSAVVDADGRDVADALAGVGQAAIETATIIGSQLGRADLGRRTPGIAAISGFGNPEG